MRDVLLGVLVALIGLAGLVEGIRLSVAHANAVLRGAVEGGYFVAAVSAVVLVSGVIDAVLSWRQLAIGGARPAAAPSQGERLFPPGVVATIAACAAYFLLIDAAGYLVSTVAFLVVTFRIAGVKSWPANVALSAGLGLASYIVFVKYGGIQFPSGYLADLLGT